MRKETEKSQEGINLDIQKYISIQWNRKRNQSGCYLFLLFESKDAINDPIYKYGINYILYKFEFNSIHF